MTMPATPEASSARPRGVVPGRECGTCTMCCKVFRIAELDKAPSQWCRHVVQGRGCGIHATRPHVCRDFFCYWMQNAEIGPEWKPERSKFVLSTEMKGKRIVVATDASSPAAWRRPVYYAQLKRWAMHNPAENYQVLVFHGTRCTAVLPDRDLDLGTVDIGDKVIYHVIRGRVEVEVVRAAADQR